TGSALPGFPSNGTLETENGRDFHFLGEARFLTSLPGIYRICYCRPQADDPTKEADSCKGPSSYKAAVGLMTVNGPLQTTTTCALGSACEVTIQGIDLAAGDAIMIVDGPCGEGGGLEALGFPDLETSVTLQSGDSGYLANLGNIPTAASPGVYTICWCPVANASDCRARRQFRATAGELHVTCPPGYYGVGPTTGRRCGPCTRGFHCAGGEVNVATRIACGPDQTTRTSGA
ncbi:ANKRD50, partial [Symbiodinium sp. CCMP2456]